MTDVIIPTWAEANGWVFLLIVALAFVIYAWVKGKKESEKYVGWIERGEW